MEILAKQVVGKAAADLIQEGMVVGLGSGSTAVCFIKALGERCRKGLSIQAVASSSESYNVADESGVPLLDAGSVTSLDLTVDGADEIDPKKQLIKGGGGDLVREKILASMSKEMIVIVDSSKLVQKLGKFPLPVEIIPFGHFATIKHLNDLGYEGKIRTLPSSTNALITENSNLIYDIQFQNLIDDPSFHEQRIRAIPGVVDTGFFLGLAGRVLVGYNDGHVENLFQNNYDSKKA